MSFKYLLLLIFLVPVAYADTIGIGVMPVVLNMSYTDLYSVLCFFNEGDTDAIYRIRSGSASVWEKVFVVPRNTSIKNCVKEFVVIFGSGYFYVEAYPVNYTGDFTIIRRVAVKVNRVFDIYDYIFIFFIVAVVVYILSIFINSWIRFM